MTNLGPDKDYLLVQAPLLDYLTVETKGPTGWEYPKFSTKTRLEGVDLPFRLGSSLLSRLGFSGIMAGFSCVWVLGRFFKPLLGLKQNLPWEFHGPTHVLLLEVWRALGPCSLVC